MPAMSGESPAPGRGIGFGHPVEATEEVESIIAEAMVDCCHRSPAEIIVRKTS